MPIDVTRDGHVATITINRPDALNAFNSEQLQALLQQVLELGVESEIRAIVLTGAGDRAFSAGADIEEMRTKTPAEALEFSRLGQALCDAIEDLPQPVIAAINGFALGGGSEVALACDIRLASENAQLGQPEVALGILPGWGATQRLPRVVGLGLAKDLILTGRRIGAEEALRIGLVSSVYPREQLLAEARKRAEQIAANGPVAVKFAKDALNQALDVNLEAGLSYEASVFAVCFSTTDQHEGMTAFLERRKATFTGG